MPGLNSFRACTILIAAGLIHGCSSTDALRNSYNPDCGITIYEDAGYGGTFSRSYNQSVHNLNEHSNAFIPIKPGGDMNDKTSSAKIYGGTWTFYVDANFNGQSYGPTTEDIPNFADIPGMNDKTSSLLCR